jgi:hypothetical protein
MRTTSIKIGPIIEKSIIPKEDLRFRKVVTEN